MRLRAVCGQVSSLVVCLCSLILLWARSHGLRLSTLGALEHVSSQVYHWRPRVQFLGF